MMVGIVLASHGAFAEGISQSAEMIFGKQTNFGSAILKPDEGPDDVRKKMEDVIASFDNQDEVLFLVDLWGGTPFNQANKLLEEHGGNWSIVTGLNLPMVIEALTQRFSVESAKEIATAIINPAKEGIKTKPESLAPKSTVKEEAKPAEVQGDIPEGTVLGDGHIKYVLARIDSRLLHGQVATGWSKAMNPDRIIVVSDNVAKDDLRKNMIREAAPTGIKAHIVPIKKMAEVDKDPRFGATKALLLFENPEDALQAIEDGVQIDTLNVGSMSYAVGKVNANSVLSMNQKDVDTFKKLKEKGIKFDVRKVPSDNPENMDAILSKAQKLLDEQNK
ncbi:PTS system, mannose fructose sorbose family, IIAB component [Lactobacillus psittaci DSM 15354]|uniref:PTS system mannose-specific EIIAB component n=2 Tax=Lactobacillus psittaci TaxID=116089 RepID=A0A0R1RZC9_9LACO|nr:PTS system, mannose fructose sorbose family, IIAB component [Lactobacillus psittaci DSM 15354]